MAGKLGQFIGFRAPKTRIHNVSEEPMFFIPLTYDDRGDPRLKKGTFEIKDVQRIEAYRSIEVNRKNYKPEGRDDFLVKRILFRAAKAAEAEDYPAKLKRENVNGIKVDDNEDLYEWFELPKDHDWYLQGGSGRTVKVLNYDFRTQKKEAEVTEGEADQIQEKPHNAEKWKELLKRIMEELVDAVYDDIPTEVKLT